MEAVTSNTPSARKNTSVGMENLLLKKVLYSPKANIKRGPTVVNLMALNINRLSGHIMEVRGGQNPPPTVSGARRQMPYFVFPRKAKYKPPT